LDLYLPAAARETQPTIVWFHGGGWSRNSKEKEMLYILPYLEMGWSVANVEYRLAAAALAPGAVQDCRCALRWIIANGQKYHLNTRDVVVSGISAGGHLALTTGMLPTSAGLDQECASMEEVKVAAIISWFGPSDVADLIAGPHAFNEAITWLGAQPDRIEIAKRVSPINYVRSGLPPIITIHGDRDNTVPYSQSVRLHQALDKAGVPNQLVTISGGGHANFSRGQTLRAYAAIREFLIKNGVTRRN
jgi:acetyl esterase/lipase